jgi:hypothetical protein
MWDEGLKLPTQVAGGRSTCFAAQRSRLRTESRVLPSTWTFGERATLIAFHCAEPPLRTPKPSRPRHSEINVGAGMRCRSLLPLNRVGGLHEYPPHVANVLPRAIRLFALR